MTNALSLQDPYSRQQPSKKSEQDQFPNHGDPVEIGSMAVKPAELPQVEIRHYLAIHFPKLPTDRIMRQRHGAAWRMTASSGGGHMPLAMVRKTNNTVRLIHLDEHAEKIGLDQGVSLADARAAFPDMEILQCEDGADRLLLEAIADWCDRYTPLVALDQTASDLHGQYGLMLDITGCAHLFGGERELMKDLLARLLHQGFLATAAIAPTPGAAWAMSRFPRKNGDPERFEAISDIRQIESVLTPLPLRALRLTGEMTSALARLGLRTIGQLNRQPRAPLARRFGRELLYRLDQAMGAIEEAISPRRPVGELMAERRFAEPVALESDIEKITFRLAGHLSGEMEKKGVGARQLLLCLFRVDGKTFRLEAGTSRPERDPATIVRLFRERFAALQDDYDAGYGFETLRLCILASEPFCQEDISFLDAESRDGSWRLMDRLAARLGPNTITRGILQNTHLPENAEREMPVREAGPGDEGCEAVNEGNIPVRPLRLFAFPEAIEAIAEVPDGPPVVFRWRKILHQVTRCEGPERIMDEWWGKTTARQTRDYFRIEDNKGHRYWLFREGLYERETSQPKWFLHGQFV